MTLTHAVHVYQPGNIPPYTENTERARYVEYGGDVSNLSFKDAFIHDETATQEQGEWLAQKLMPQLQKGGNVRYLPSPSPMSKSAVMSPSHPDHPDHEHEDCCK